MNKTSCALCLALLTGAALAAATLPTLTGSVVIGGKGGWDYVAVDPSSHRVFVSHESRMLVVDPAAGKVVAEIPGTPGVHGIAFAPGPNRGFITCGKSDALVVIDLTSFKTLGRLEKIGKKPDAVTYDPFTRRVFVMNNGGGGLAAVDPESLAVIGTVDLGGAPETPQSDLAGRLYVNLEDRNQVKVVDAATLKVLATWSLAPHETPTGMAIDLRRNRLFVGCRSGRLVVLDLATGGIVAALPIGAGVDACAYDPATGLAYASCKDGTVTVIQAGSGDDYTVAGTLRTEAGSKTLALDPASHRVFVPAAGGPGTPGKAGAGFQLLEFD